MPYLTLPPQKQSTCPKCGHRITRVFINGPEKIISPAPLTQDDLNELAGTLFEERSTLPCEGCGRKFHIVSMAPFRIRDLDSGQTWEFNPTP